MGDWVGVAFWWLLAQHAQIGDCDIDLHGRCACAGYETMLWARWSTEGEYLYVDSSNDVALPPGTANLTGSVNTSMLRVGVNHHF